MAEANEEQANQANIDGVDIPSESVIKKMKRGELNELAASIGLSPDDYSRADDLKSAIFKAAQQQAAETEDSEAVEVETQDDEAKDKDTKTQKHNPPKPRLMRKSKRYRQAHEQIDKYKYYSLPEALQLAKDTSNVNFEATVEAHINLGVDPKQSDQLVRGNVVLPHGSGTTRTVAVLAPKTEHDKLKKAGADIVGEQDLLDAIGKGDINFDILICHTDMMRDLSKHAKVLGPKGLMPSPKANTVSDNPAETVKLFKSGQIEFRVDRYGNVHQSIGKDSYDVKQLQENAAALIEALKAAKPPSTKGVYMQKVFITTSMGPAIKVDTSSLD